MSNWQALQSQMEVKGTKRKRERQEKSATETETSLKIKKKRSHQDEAPGSRKHTKRASQDHAGSQHKVKAIGKKDAATDAPEIQSTAMATLVTDTRSAKIGKYLALDCEMVGTNAPPIGPRESSTLARISITNYHGHVIYDSYVGPPKGHTITDYRTWVSGIKPHHLYKAPPFEEVQMHVRDLLKGRILVGHALINDFKALQFTHPKHMVRDTSTFTRFKEYAVGRTPGLKKVAQAELGIDIQGREHSSIEDARACMALYRKYKLEFEEKAKQRAMGF